MKTRVIAGLAAAICVVLLNFWGSPELVFAVALLCSVMAYLEYDRLLFPMRSRGRVARICILVVLTLIAMRQGPVPAWVAAWCSFVIIGACQVFISERHSDFPLAIRHVSLELLGYTYVVSLFGFILPILTVSGRGRWYLILLFLLVFVGDTAAYFVGSRWGRHRLAPHISPRKSTEGAWAAVLSSVIVASLWYAYSPMHLKGSHFALKVVLFAPVVSLLAQLGDLFESILKRSQSQKDSGHFLPGHGGILDRIDGLSLASPLFFFYVIYVLERA